VDTEGGDCCGAEGVISKFNSTYRERERESLSLTAKSSCAAEIWGIWKIPEK
jgi:hypothetical protein